MELFIIGVAILVTLLVVTVAVLGVRGAMNLPGRPSGRPVSPADLDARARMLIARGRPVHAIRLVRRQTGLSVTESKRYVDDLIAGGVPPWPGNLPLPGNAAPPRGDLAGRVRELKAAGRAEQAVLLVRGETGMDEDEARRFVEAIG
ncbi:hypothetical protein Plo01_45390 [Planobispora longispora]|uniref:Ribosomal protein L7/L12 C-terminal domain-containing protein n=1 Tax=Planobispora longispora TaxID=28887 RepID=A0A8J3W6V6_9ACTN|nr:hypothetical protein Plo01_45390 [Planobispora longispora]